MHRWLLAVILPIAVAACGWGPFVARPTLPTGVRVESLGDNRAAFADAYESFQRGDLERALPIFTALVTSYPQLADYHLYFIGVINERQGAPEAAAAAFDRLLRDYTESVNAPMAAVALGTLLIHAGDVERGREWLQATLETPDAATAQAARLALAEADEGAGDYAAAIKGFMQVRHAAVGSRAARVAREHVHALRAAHPELAPTTPELLEEARLLLSEGDYAGAKATVEEIALRPDAGGEPTDVLRVLADALYGLGETERALAVLREIVDRFPDSAAAPSALFRRASILWNRDRDEEALQAFGEYRVRYAQQPRADEAVYAIGRIHEQAGQSQAAIDTYRELARSYPSSTVAAEARWRVGWIQYRAASWSAAAATFAEVATYAQSRRRTEAAYWQARALAHAGREAAARRVYSEIIDREPTDYYAMWAERQIHGGSRLVVTTESPAVDAAAPQPALPDPPPTADAFHVDRWQELKAAGVYGLARAELAAIGRGHRDDPATMGYLLVAYQTVDGYASALRLLQRLSSNAGLSAAERQHLQYPLAFWEPVRREAQASDIDPLLVQAVMRQESLFDPAARSSAGALGLMQVMPATARRMATAAEGNVDSSELLQPDLNIRLGVRELSELLQRFHGDVLKAVAAYNGGAAAVEKWVRRAPELDADEFVESISFRETRDYVKRVISNYRQYRALYASGA